MYLRIAALILVLILKFNITQKDDQTEPEKFFSDIKNKP